MNDETPPTTSRPTSDPARPLPRRHRWRLLLLRGALGLVVLLVVIQAVPYGRDHSNPLVTREPAWDSAATRDLTARACFDCHSNETKWPWYTNVAPSSWLVQSDVDGGRDNLNFSEWNRPQEAGGEIAEIVRSGEMPPLQYRILHAGARLSDAERDALVRGLEATLRASPPIPGRG